MKISAFTAISNISKYHREGIKKMSEFQLKPNFTRVSF